MARCGVKWEVMRNMKMVVLSLMLVLAFASGHRSIKSDVFGLDENETHLFSSYILKTMDFFWKTGGSAYQHVWPVSFSHPHAIFLFYLPGGFSAHDFSV